MPASFTLRIKVDAEATKEDLRSISLRLRTLHKILPKIGKILQEDFKQTFKSRGDGSWPALSPITIMVKREQGYPSTPLIRTRYMYRRATSGAWYSAALGGGMFAAMLPVPGYSGFHWNGTRFMPKRDWADLTDKVDTPVLETVAGYIMDYA